MTTPQRRRSAVRCLMVVPTEAPGWSSELIDGMVSAAAQRSGWSLLLEPSGGISRKIDLLRRSHALRGIVMLPNSATPVRDILALGIPTVTICNPLPGTPCVRPDDHLVGRMAAQHLARFGWRPVMVSEYPTHWQAQRLAGWRAILPGADHAYLPPEHDTLTAWLSRQQGPLAVFAANDVIASRLATASMSARRRLGQDLRILGVDDDLMARACRPALSSIRLPYMELGRQAVHTLAELLHGRSPPSDRIVGTPQLVARGSSDPMATDDATSHAAIGRIRERLTQHPHLPSSDLIEDAGMAQPGLARLWRQTHGRSLSASLKILRCDMALELMRTGSRDLQFLGSHLGFEGEQGLLDALKTCFRLTPRTIRSWMNPASSSPLTHP